MAHPGAVAVAVAEGDAGPGAPWIYRHRLPTRVAHAAMALCVPALLVTGAEILAHHPRLYWGEAGFFGDPALLSFGSEKGSLGLGFRIGEARSVHFAAAWLLLAAWLLHLAASAANGHLRRDLWPERGELARPLLRSVADHARLRLPHGEAARSYDVLQKLAYLAVLLALVPLAILTGLAMSPAVVASWPELLVVLGGRQSARTLHFAAAAGLLLFLTAHLAMVLLTEARTGLRAILTGWHELPGERRP